MSGHAIITGGSSGIGLAFAKLLGAEGLNISIIARDESKLKKAVIEIESTITHGAKVQWFSADVGDDQLCATAVANAIESFGPPTWAIACAGIVHAGRFIDQTILDHQKQFGTNYFGTVNFVQAVIPTFQKGATANLVIVGSGAAFSGIYGYGSYGPSKFAVRGLAETLRVELHELGITVTLVCPADTNTPQLIAELHERHLVTNHLAQAGEVYSAAQVAKKAITYAKQKKFLVTFGWRLSILSVFHSLIGAPFRGYQVRLAQKLNTKNDN